MPPRGLGGSLARVLERAERGRVPGIKRTTKLEFYENFDFSRIFMFFRNFASLGSLGVPGPVVCTCSITPVTTWWSSGPPGGCGGSGWGPGTPGGCPGGLGGSVGHSPRLRGGHRAPPVATGGRPQFLDNIPGMAIFLKKHMTI